MGFYKIGRAVPPLKHGNFLIMNNKKIIEAWQKKNLATYEKLTKKKTPWEDIKKWLSKTVKEKPKA